MESESVDVVGESGERAVSPLVVAGTGSPGRLDPGRIRQPAGADDARAELAVGVGQSGQAGQHSFVSTPVAAVEESCEERVDEGTEADTEEAASSFIDVVGIDSPEKRKAVPENGTRDNVAVGASEPLDSDVVDIAGLPDCKLSNSLL